MSSDPGDWNALRVVSTSPASIRLIRKSGYKLYLAEKTGCLFAIVTYLVFESRTP